MIFSNDTSIFIPESCVSDNPIRHERPRMTTNTTNNVKILKTNLIIKTYLELILYKPVGKYQFTMACIRALVMIVYQLTNCLIWDGSFEHQIIC